MRGSYSARVPRSSLAEFIYIYISFRLQKSAPFTFSKMESTFVFQLAQGLPGKHFAALGWRKIEEVECPSAHGND